MPQKSLEIIRTDTGVQIRDVALGLAVHTGLHPYATYTEFRNNREGVVDAININPRPADGESPISVVDLGDNQVGIEWDPNHYPFLPGRNHYAQTPLELQILRVAQLRKMLALPGY